MITIWVNSLGYVNPNGPYQLSRVPVHTSEYDKIPMNKNMICYYAMFLFRAKYYFMIEDMKSTPLLQLGNSDTEYTRLYAWLENYGVPNED